MGAFCGNNLAIVYFMRNYYPQIEPFDVRHLAVAGGHQVYVEQCGSPSGIPVVFLHGGPGSGCGPEHRRYFDPRRYRVVLFDQRGSGRSMPHGRLTDNNTPALIADMEQIRETLGISQWLLFGGSWGSTLALAYALAQPQQVLGMVLRGSFLGTRPEVDWLLEPGGAQRMFPEVYPQFEAGAERATGQTMLEAYSVAVNSHQADRAWRAASAWDAWTSTVATHTLNPSPSRADRTPPDTEHRAMRIRKVALECHYAMNRYFLPEAGLLDGLRALQGITVMLAHGRLDIMCPLRSSWCIQQALGEQCALQIVPSTGHLGNEPGMVDALVSMADEFALVLQAHQQ